MEIKFTCNHSEHKISLSELCASFALVIESRSKVCLRIISSTFKQQELCQKTHFCDTEFELTKQEVEILLNAIEMNITVDKDLQPQDNGSIIVDGDITDSTFITGNNNEVEKTYSFGNNQLTVIIVGSGIKFSHK